MADGKWHTTTAPTQGGSQPIKAGYLTKMGEVRKTWKKRWFQLETTGSLCYYKDASYVTGKPLGSIIVEGCQIEPQSAAVIGRPFAFSIVPPVSGERVYNIFADSSRDLQEWVDALREVAKRVSGKRSQRISSLSHHKMNYNDNLYSSSLPVQISGDGRIYHATQQRTEKAALANRRQKRMHTSSTSSDSCYSDESDFEGAEEDTLEEEDTETSSSVFRCDMEDTPVAAKRKGTSGNMFRISEVMTDAFVILTEPKNNLCADCKNENSECVTTTFGMFLCTNCGDAHSLLPDSLSFVKHAVRDNFTSEELQKLREIGNVAGNAVWEAKLPAKFDFQTISTPQARLEFVRKKYLHKAFTESPPNETEDLKQQVSRLQHEIGEKSQEILDLRKRLDSGAASMSAQTEIERLRKLLEVETERRRIAEEERNTAKENEALANKKLQEERNRMRDLSSAAFTLQDNVKTVYDGLMKMTTQMIDDTGSEGAGSMGQSGPSHASYGTSFVESSPSNSFFSGSDFVEIRETVPEGEDSLVFEKFAFLN